ncbi:MAG: metallophosphoesterase [Devosia sp.]
MTVLIAQISDIHARPEGASLDALKRAVDWLRDRRPDALVVSGDVAGKSQREGYGLVRDALAKVNYPVFMIPGNVDDRATMRAAFPEHDYWPASGAMNFARTIGGMRIIGLDVTVPGESHGDAGPVADWLHAQLDAGGPPAMIFMHQNAFRTGIPELDRNMCRNAEQLVDAIAGEEGSVLAISCGHGHRAIYARLGQVPAMMCPSLTKASPVLIAAREEPEVTDPPGLMLHQLTESGLVSHVVSLGGAS